MIFMKGAWRTFLVSMLSAVAFAGNVMLDTASLLVDDPLTASFRNVKLWSGELKSNWERTRKSLAREFPAVEADS